MARQWRGVLREYAEQLGVSETTPVITLGEGGTPLIPAPSLEARTGARVRVKFEGMNPTGSFKDRGMAVAVSRAVERGAELIVCASAGNTSASAAAYAARAGIAAAVLVPEGAPQSIGLSQAIAHGASLLRVRGGLDDCLRIARELAGQYPAAHLVNSVNDDRVEGQKTAAFEIADELGDAPDFHFLPLGNAGNYTAHARGYREYAQLGRSTRLPRLFGFQATGAAPIVRGELVAEPETIASAIRIGNPASWRSALEARDETNGYFGAIDDEAILAAQRILATELGLLAEAASAISLAGLLDRAAAGVIPAGASCVLTVTGHGLKDAAGALGAPGAERPAAQQDPEPQVSELQGSEPQASESRVPESRAAAGQAGPVTVAAELGEVAAALGLGGAA